MARKVIDAILWIEGFYPFSFKFDLKRSYKKHEMDLEQLTLDPTSISIFKYSDYFNAYFKNICKALEEVINKSELDKSTFINLLIASLNRTELIIFEETKQRLKAGPSYDSNMQANVYLKKKEFQNGTESAWGLLDSAIETAILNLNYLNYVEFSEKKEIKNDLTQIELLKNIEIIGSTFNAIKQAYDRIIWRGYEIKFDESNYKLESNQHHLMLENAALTRLTRNINNIENQLHYTPEEFKEIIKTYHTTRKFQIIKSIDEENCNLVPRYKAKSRKPTNSFFSFISPIITYYPFFQSEKISSFDNLTILELVNLFSTLNDFIALLPMPKYKDTEVKNLEKFKLFNPKIRKKILVNYFKKTTKFTEKQILIFLDLLTQKGKNHNLFLYPIYEEKEYYFFSHTNIKRANMLYLVDKWLGIGNCDLSDRGFKFEAYVKDFLKDEKLNDFAKFVYVEHSMFSFLDENNNRHREEIDLVLTTKSSIIVAEIKCISYPFDSNDFYSSYQTLKKAKNQVIRKAKFLEDNWIKFENLIGKKQNKKIEKIIIVNFPQFAGRVIDNIPIADFYLFLSYFQSGKFTNVKIERNKEATLNEILYYDSVSSFERNFGPFFLNPYPIQELISRQKLEEYEVTLQGTKPKTIAERVVYLEKTSSDE